MKTLVCILILVQTGISLILAEVARRAIRQAGFSARSCRRLAEKICRLQHQKPTAVEINKVILSVCSDWKE